MAMNEVNQQYAKCLSNSQKILILSEEVKVLRHDDIKLNLESIKGKMAEVDVLAAEINEIGQGGKYDIRVDLAHSILKDNGYGIDKNRTKLAEAEEIGDKTQIEAVTQKYDICKSIMSKEFWNDRVDPVHFLKFLQAATCKDEGEKKNRFRNIA